jgi:endonuclease YncB( thermonuclease family)
MTRVTATMTLVWGAHASDGGAGKRTGPRLLGLRQSGRGPALLRERGPRRIHRLDADGDGKACDANPCPCREPGGGRGGGGGGDRTRSFQTIRSKVIRVIDGDTIVIRPLEATKRPRYTVRLLGIDSPEKRPKECGANLATDNLRRLAPRGRRVLLKTDPTQPMFDRFDGPSPTPACLTVASSTRARSPAAGPKCSWSAGASSSMGASSGRHAGPVAKIGALGASAGACTSGSHREIS